MSSVRVVARVRPLLKSELNKDTIITTASSHGEDSNKANIVRIPNPKNAGEDFSFQFNSVYDQEATQQDIFDNEGGLPIYDLFGSGAKLRFCSVADHQAPFRRIRRYTVRIWSHWYWKDAHNARR